MKNKLFGILLAIGLLISSTTNAQKVFDQGDLQFNAGLGLVGTYLGRVAPSVDFGFLPSINVSGEYGVIPTGNIGVVSFGGLIAMHYASHSNSYNNYWGTSYTESNHVFSIAFEGRAAWHLHTLQSDKWDVYTGIGMGLITGISSRTVTYWGNTKTYSDPFTNFVYSTFVGGRMMMNDQFGLFAEVGYDALSIMKLGITFKI